MSTHCVYKISQHITNVPLLTRGMFTSRLIFRVMLDVEIIIDFNRKLFETIKQVLVPLGEDLQILEISELIIGRQCFVLNRVWQMVALFHTQITSLLFIID